MARRDAEFTEYVDERRPTLRRAAYLLCGDWTQAEDVVQVVLMKLYVAWPRVHRDRADAYVRRMIARTAVDEWRRPSRRAVLPGDALIDLVPAAPAGVGYEERSVLLAALRQLPGRQRQIVVLRHWWGCSVAEVARDLMITQGTVKSQTARALVRLKSILGPPAGQPSPPSPPHAELIGES
ncbi:SigE family RNA polymerase sigma factor [Microlunatus parietis]|uniref:RNA polymerase sigma-70 factor (Sigma-E family) n=1 Tax=Microlunatus parietis TaxID=682979 RepID=A0A7Y9I332_9ACTN|nr:SigE family RNA polymerase sigma factor [Microlunatus parietis]NYE69034.1 RNA polymerase sigma-70 factor (sigma-E family) [Microlunatus parietis]